MEGVAGKAFSLARENPWISGCTVSKTVAHAGSFYLACFSLAPDTDISPETYSEHKLIMPVSGSMSLRMLDATALTGSANAAAVRSRAMQAYDLAVSPLGIPVGMRTEEGCVYVEAAIEEESAMNDALKPGEVVALANLLPYQEGRVVNMDLARNDKMKFMLMSFDAGTGLTEHSAPGDAVVFALEGCATIGYEGSECRINAGESIRFAKNGKHYVTADERFKMALLIVLD